MDLLTTKPVEMVYYKRKIVLKFTDLHNFLDMTIWRRHLGRHIEFLKKLQVHFQGLLIC